MSESEHARFKAVFLPHLADARRLARWLTGDGADADDVAQEAALRALGAIGQFSGANARAWCMAITRNAAYSFLKRRRGAQARIEAEAEIEALADAATPETLLLEKIEAAAFEAAIAALPTTFREMLVLRDLQGLNYREIAQVTGAPIGTVMSRLARARKLLMIKLADPRP